MEIEFTGERLVPGKTPYGMLQEHIGRYVFASTFVKDSDFVLDIACGTGYGTSYLGKKACRVVGGDIDEQTIRYAHSLYSKGNVTFVASDCAELPFAGSSFDVIVSFETIEHLQYYEYFLEECQRVMKEDGMFICSTPNRAIFSPRGLDPRGYHLKEFTSEELDELLRKYWRHITMYGQCHVSRAALALRVSKDHLFRIAGRCLSILPEGEKIKELIKQCLVPGQVIDPSWREISSQMLDRRYTFLPLEDARPMFLGAVASHPLNEGSETP